ncbi:hypothetical protein AB0M25_20300 [Streptomyces griseomycini]|uniref:hypothetical protein n=1 Tax=Streptomyces griseomycini TaxID=66895 RepID=UPI0034158DF7
MTAPLPGGWGLLARPASRGSAPGGAYALGASRIRNGIARVLSPCPARGRSWASLVVVAVSRTPEPVPIALSA